MPQLSPYSDVEIRLGQQEEAGYPIEVTVNGEQEYDGGHLAASFLPWVSGTSAAEDGAKLFGWLLAEDAFKVAWAEIRGQHPQRRVRLRLNADAPELHALPWELLHDPDVTQDLAAGAATPFSRYLAGRWLPGSPILKRPIKILLAVANPANLADYQLAAVNPDEEWAAFQAALAEVPDVEITRLEEPCTLSALEAALREGYHILHLIAHGQYNQRREQTVLYLADADNQVALVNGDELSDMLTRQLADLDTKREDKLRLVFLASCQTATQNPADAFRAVAPALVAAGVPAVLAMQDLVPLETARTFSQIFYQQILQHGQVDLASNEARASLMTAKLPGAAIPVLFMRLRAGLLFGERGQILEGKEGSFWRTLLENIYDGDCTPFLGPGVTEQLLPSQADLAADLAIENNYPFSGQIKLPQVAQFVGARDEVRLRQDVLRHLTIGFKKRLELTDEAEEAAGQSTTPRRRSARRRTQSSASSLGLAETIAAANWSTRSREILESEIHHQLAALELPLYLTTNFDNFMSLALEAQDYEQVRRETIAWREGDALPGDDDDQQQQFFDLDPPPSVDEPVVLHLFGSEADLQSMVLTQDDHLDYLARISRDHEYLLPTSVQKALCKTTLLFLGYRLEALDFKVIMRGLLPQLDLKRWRRLRVAVQVEASPDNEAKKEEIIEYFQNYFAASQEARIDVYWGSTHQFVADLHARWEAYLEERNAQES